MVRHHHRDLHYQNMVCLPFHPRGEEYPCGERQKEIQEKDVGDEVSTTMDDILTESVQSSQQKT